MASDADLPSGLARALRGGVHGHGIACDRRGSDLSPDSRRTDRRESYRRQEDRRDAHEARIRGGVRYGIVIVAVVLGLYGSYEATQTADEAKSQSARLAAVTRDVAVTQRAIAEVHMRILNTQRALLVSQKASAETRVKTVSQRCALTAQILTVLKKHDLGDYPPFEASFTKCEAQLKTVVQIARMTPSP